MQKSQTMKKEEYWKIGVWTREIS